MADVLLVIIVLFIGVLIRFFIPYFLKIYKGEITWKDVDWRYIASAAVAFIASLTIGTFFNIAAMPEPNVYIYALFFGIGGHELANNALKFIEHYRTKQKSDTPPTPTDT